MNILIAPDSFKGTLGAERVCRIARYAAKRAFHDCYVKELPIADGGEGTARIMTKALAGTVETIAVEGPFGKTVKARIGFVDKGNTAIIESAEAIGLPLAGKRANPERTSSFGVGQMIAYSVSRGASKIILTLGGSSTNDLGAGMLSAMGVQFVDINGNRFTPIGGNLSRVETIEFNQEFSKYRDKEFILMCDVDNPLLGDDGCAKVYAPQKGASPEAVVRLESGAVRLSEIVTLITGRDERFTPGAGAAGGIAFGAMSFLKAKVKRGIDVILQMYDFERQVEWADMVITGEGKLDEQSFMGKAVGGILAVALPKPCVVLCGINAYKPLPEGANVVCISDGVGGAEYAMKNAAECLRKALDKYFASIK